MDIWDVLKDFVVYPILGIAGYIMRKHIQRLEKVEEQQQKTETRISVIESKVDDLRDDIKEIKQNVQKLVERK